MGRPKHKPTEEERTKVQSLAACGISHKKIALIMGFRSPKTLRVHYRKVLDVAATEANATVAAALYSNAVHKKDTRAQEIWLKCRAGWHDRTGCFKKQLSGRSTLEIETFPLSA